MQVILIMRTIVFLLVLFAGTDSLAQNGNGSFDSAYSTFEKDEQFAHASIGLYVVNSKTGQVFFDKNSQVGLAPASTQKVITSATAYELLGKDFTYKTRISYDGAIAKNLFKGDLIVEASGDPTLGSWRWKQTSGDSIFRKLGESLKKEGIKALSGNIELNTRSWETQATPNGWIWEDIGNYYGAGASILNWHENSFNLELRPGKNVGDSVKLLRTDPMVRLLTMVNELKTGKVGSGDNAIIYLPEGAVTGFVRGTVPAGTDKFTIKGAIPRPDAVFANEMRRGLMKVGVLSNLSINPFLQRKPSGKPAVLRMIKPLVSLESPIFDSMNYWFMKESINLYGEAFVKTIAFQKKGFGSREEGLELVTDFWKDKGISPAELNIQDGSGLSPANRITPHAMVEVLRYAAKQPWYASFEHSLPLQNNIKMKSGSISKVRAYAGYIKSKSGEEYSFAFMINNFNGSAASVRQKMWKLLDLLK